MDAVLVWIAVVAGITMSFAIGAWITHRRYVAGYIDGYLDALDGDGNDTAGDVTIPDFT